MSRRVIAAIIVLWTLVTLITAIGMRIFGDASTAGMLLLFGPRWLLVLPWLLLLPLAWFASRAIRVTALVGVIIGVFGVGQFTVPWRRLAASNAAGPRLRVLTWNTDRARPTVPRMRTMLAEWDADLILLQDCSSTTATALGADIFRDRARWLFSDGEFCIRSRIPIDGVEAAPPEPTQGRGVRVHLTWNGAPLTVVVLHLESPRDALSAARRGRAERLATSLARRSEGSRRFADWALASPPPPNGALIVAGDFNLPYGGLPLRRDWGTLTNAFAESGWGWGYTMFAGRHRVRIDHILVGSAFTPLRTRVLRGYPSEHQPVVTELVLSR
jgi:endonuclease/exonuclease/phosphatase (EEP) superfamily protein YafD